MWRAMHLLRFAGQADRSRSVPPIDRLPCRLPQPPRLNGQAHEWPQIRTAARADTRAAKARLADRTVVDHGHSAVSLDEEQELFECARGFLQLAGVVRVERGVDLFVQLDRGLAIVRMHLVEQPA